MEDNKQAKIESLARQIMSHARDSILVNMRFLDVALAALIPVSKPGSGQFACDGSQLYYDPVLLLTRYQKESAIGTRLYLHCLFHQLFYHNAFAEKVEKNRWDVATDIAVENAVLELGIPGSSLSSDEEKRRSLRALSQEISVLTAEKIYRYFKNTDISPQSLAEYGALFGMDTHLVVAEPEKIELSLEQWKKISERVQADLKSFSKGKTDGESLAHNLAEALRDRYDYGELLRKFTVMNEDIQINEDEFDYIYYTYGLSKYGNMPLVEPLEYKDAKKVKEFVIAIDTSASCRGELVSSFLKKTYGILMSEETFFKKMNVHIIQCDNEVRSDIKITCKEDFDAFLKNGKLTGFGSTDFRPVFTHIEKLLSEGEFENLKGLIYFTDGYGVYPQKMPPYDVMFVFVGENIGQPPEVPSWAIRVVLDDEEV